MYCVFYMELRDSNEVLPTAVKCEDLNNALKEAEAARTSGHKFVTIGVENPNMVGSLGVCEPPKDYYWHKRRP